MVPGGRVSYRLFPCLYRTSDREPAPCFIRYWLSLSQQTGTMKQCNWYILMSKHWYQRHLDTSKQFPTWWKIRPQCISSQSRECYGVSNPTIQLFVQKIVYTIQKSQSSALLTPFEGNPHMAEGWIPFKKYQWCGRRFHVISSRPSRRHFAILWIVTGFYTHDDIIKWKHISRYWPFVRGIRRSPVNSPHKGQWRGALMFSVICAMNK